jgi:2'-deoxynucleoside 5'-phosphate N-hydrolase
MNIYFAGSIRGGRDDLDIYVTLIEELKKYGEVYTEHIGNKSLTDAGEELTSEEIYTRDMEWLRAADIVVAEVTQPSLGVGYEVAHAEAMGKPILCMHRPIPGKRVSAMIGGNPHLSVHGYVSMSEAADILREFCTSRKETPAQI